VLGASASPLHLVADGEIARQQPEADGNTIGMQPIADQVIEIMAVLGFLDGLLGPSSPQAPTFRHFPQVSDTGPFLVAERAIHAACIWMGGRCSR
jgi:hypothetical protein